MATSNQEYRADYRTRYIGRHYAGWLHFAFTAAVSLGVIVLSASRLEDMRPLEWLTLPLTFLYANLSEYLGHRGPMHHPRRGLRALYERHTLRHHRFFTHQHMQFDDSRDFHAVLFPPLLILFFTLAFALPAGLLLGWLFSANVAWLFVLTSLAYFLNYELMHFAWHLPTGSWVYRLPFMKALRKLHLDHHNPALMSRYNFNITYPIADRLFGTLYSKDSGDCGSGRD